MPFPVLMLSLLALFSCTEAQELGVQNLSSASAAASRSQASGENATELPLSVPEGFRLDVFAENLPGVRAIIRDSFGNYWVSQPEAGTVSVLEVREGGAVEANPVFTGLNGPHGLVLDGTMLYIAEEDRIARIALYSDDQLTEIARLPPGGRHRTRSIVFGLDGRLYVSIGSTCDVCIEKDERHGTVLSMEKDGSDSRIVARGLRNAVFMERHPATGEIWATDMGRDHLGDDLPPEEVNILEEGAHYGWPWCYGDGVRDATFESGRSFDCTQTAYPRFSFQAHSAPLGLAFLIGDGWPRDLRDDLLVARHGSWNRSVPVGYDIVRFPLDANGNPTGEMQSFLEGFRTAGGEVLGRPVDLLAEPDGTLLITDDKRGAIYRLKKM